MSASFIILVTISLYSSFNVKAEITKAVAVIQGESGLGSKIGVVTFNQLENCIHIQGQLEGLNPGEHGFHVHTLGDHSNSCTSAGSHYNPFNKQHGGPDDEDRHVGDLGNVMADSDGVARINITDQFVRLSGDTSVIGRSLVVHQLRDDLGKGGNAESKKTGNAGARIACGVIGIGN